MKKHDKCYLKLCELLQMLTTQIRYQAKNSNKNTKKIFKGK